MDFQLHGLLIDEYLHDIFRLIQGRIYNSFEYLEYPYERKKKDTQINDKRDRSFTWEVIQRVELTLNRKERNWKKNNTITRK